jgi:hypothetical protein
MLRYSFGPTKRRNMSGGGGDGWRIGWHGIVQQVVVDKKNEQR